MTPQVKRQLGQLLCEDSYLSPSGLASALLEQQNDRRRLGQILLKQGSITEAQLKETLAIGLSYSFL